MNKLYSYKGQLVALSSEDVVKAISAHEKSLRTDKFTYVDQQAFQSQVDEIKASWPEAMRHFVRDRAKEISGQGPVTLTAVRRAILATCEFIAQERARLNTSTTEDMELRLLTAETNLATIFRRAPDPAVAPCSIASARRYQENGKLIRIRPSVAPRNLVVNIPEIESADIYVQSMYVEAARRSILLGYVTKDDLKKAKAIEKIDADTPDWKKKAYSVPLAGLRPMAELYKECGLTEIPISLAMESVPNVANIPILAPKALQSMNKGQSKDEFDFDASVGIKTTPKIVTVATTIQASVAPQPKNDLGTLGDL